MPSSHRIIKAGNSSAPIEHAPVTTTWQPKIQAARAEEKNPVKEDYQAERQQIEAIMEETRAEKQAVLSAAKAEAEELKAKAETEGYQIGEKKGVQEGFRSGYQKGLESAIEEAKEVKENANQILAEAEKQVALFYEEKKKEMIELAAQMAEKIIHEKIDSSDEKLIALIAPILSRMEQKDTFITITVNPELQEAMKKNLGKLETEYPLFRFVVLADVTLEKNGCVIESSHAIVDLQIKQQLEAMVADLKEL